MAGGEGIEVTNANKRQFVDAMCEWRLFGSIEPQMEALLRGLEAAVPRSILAQLSQLVRPEDLARMLAGEPIIDVDDWEKHSATSGGLRRSSRCFRWFWRAVRTFTALEHEQLLQCNSPGSSAPQSRKPKQLHTNHIRVLSTVSRVMPT